MRAGLSERGAAVIVVLQASVRRFGLAAELLYTLPQHENECHSGCQQTALDRGGAALAGVVRGLDQPGVCRTGAHGGRIWRAP